MLEFVAWRGLFYASFVAFAALSLPAFGIHVPLRALIGLVPVTMSIAALPVTVAGIGSTQAAMWTLYGPFGEPAAVLAYSLVYGATLVLFRLPIALVCLPAASDVLARREVHWKDRNVTPNRCSQLLLSLLLAIALLSPAASRSRTRTAETSC